MLGLALIAAAAVNAQDEESALPLEPASSSGALRAEFHSLYPTTADIMPLCDNCTCRVPLHRGSPARLASSSLAKLFSLSISYRPFAVELSPATHLYPFRELEVETVNGTMTAVADRAVCQSVFRVKSALRIEPGRCGSFAKGASGGAAPAAAVSARPPPSEAAAVVHAASASAAAQQATPVARIRRAPLR